MRSAVDHTVLPAIYTPYPPLPRTRSPNGATIAFSSIQLIAAYCLFIDPERMIGQVGLVG